VRYLSLDWIEAPTEEVAASPEMAEAATSHRVGVTQVVDAGPEGTVIYHLTVGDGTASFGPGPAIDEDVRFQQDWKAAVGVATGSLTAHEAFITGRIRLTGDHQVLLDNQPVFAALDTVFSRVRERTEYV
jgi:putative sterol carrier protein